jgi:two-component sensor histidine kinase
MAKGAPFAGGMGQVWVHIQASDGAQRLDAPLNTTNIAIAPISTGGFWAVRYYTDRILYRTDQHGLAIDSLPLPVERLPYECFQLTEDRNGTVWIASTNGLIRFDPHTRRFDRIPIPLSANSNVYVHDLRELPNGDLGLALGALGFAVYSGAKASFRTLDPAVPGSAADVRAISVQDPDHVLLTIGDGILQVDLRDLSYRALLPDSLRVRVLSGVSGCAALNDGSIMAWSPVRGPVRLVRSTTDPEHYGVDEVFTMPGYPYFTGGCTDEHGDLWLTSDQALWRYSAGSHGFTRFDEFNGAPFSASGSVSPEINGGVLVLSGEGWWRLREGFEPHNEVPVARIRNVLVHGSPTDLHQDTVTTRKLAHDRNAITVEYGAVALFTGLDLSYAYRMSVDGATGEWVDQGPQRSVAFVDLPPGEYRLEVRVRPAAGTIPDPSPDALPAVATWTITPPWWGTWWARAAMLLVAALGTAAITRWLISLRYRRRIAALEQEGEIERMRSRIARDIHDGIGSGLTRINMMSRRLEGADPEQVARIARTSAELVQELGGIVWTVDPRNDVFSTFMAHVRSTVGKQFDGLHVELTTDYSLAKGDEDRSMDPVIKRHVLLMLNEAVNNALKHSGADRIEVRLHLSRNEVVLRVKDNGHGFDVAGPRLQGNGLANFRKRAESMAGEAAITSDADGTVVSLRARLP